MELNLEPAVFGHFMRSLSEAEFKVFMWLAWLAAKTPRSIAHVAHSEIEYHCDLSHVTVGKSIKRLIGLGAVRRLPPEPLDSARNYEIVSGNKINLASYTSGAGASASLASLQLTAETRNRVMIDVHDEKFQTWLGQMNPVALKADLGETAFSLDQARSYFTERILPLLEVADSEIVEAFHRLKGEGQV